MAFQKSSPEIMAQFARLLPKHPDATPKKMFGYPACFVKGNFFIGLYEEDYVVRMPGAQKDQLPDMKDASGFNPMGKGSGMKDWWIVPKSVTTSEEGLARFIDAAFEQILTLPEKVKKPKATKKPRK